MATRITLFWEFFGTLSNKTADGYMLLLRHQNYTETHYWPCRMPHPILNKKYAQTFPNIRLLQNLKERCEKMKQLLTQLYKNEYLRSRFMFQWLVKSTCRAIIRMSVCCSRVLEVWWRKTNKVFKFLLSVPSLSLRSQFFLRILTLSMWLPKIIWKFQTPDTHMYVKLIIWAAE